MKLYRVAYTPLDGKARMQAFESRYDAQEYYNMKSDVWNKVMLTKFGAGWIRVKSFSA